jgi:cobalt-zinc-cadmium efflux system outer membrane protein
MTTWEVAESLPPIPPEERPLDNIESFAMTNRFDLASARRAMENAEYALNLRSKTRFLPTALHVGGSTEREPHGERLTGPEIELELPLFDQGQGEIARLGAHYRQAQRRFEALAINARSEVVTGRMKIPRLRSKLGG